MRLKAVYEIKKICSKETLVFERTFEVTAVTHLISVLRYLNLFDM